MTNVRDCSRSFRIVTLHGMPLVKFQEHFVNPLHVLRVVEGSDGYTFIHFVNGEHITVKLPLTAVRKAIDEALDQRG